MGLWQYILNTVLLDLWQLCEFDEKQRNMGPLGKRKTFILHHYTSSVDVLF